MADTKKIKEKFHTRHKPINIKGIFDQQKSLIIYGVCLFISLLYLLIATKSSPLYPFNDWVDTNASFTMGKAMMNGRVLYRDIFDQRGPLLYFLYGLAYLISNASFLGVFILEVLSFCIFLFFSYKLLILYLDIEYAIISLPVLAAVVLNLKSFAQGGSPEELSLPLVAIGLYHLLAYYKEIYPKPMPNKWVLINGVIAGCVLWIKFSLLGFWFGWMLSLFISLLVKNGIVRAVKASLVFLSGMLLASLPWVVYFRVHQSISEWINVYFVLNLTSYSTTTSIISTVKSTVFGFLYLLKSNPVIFSFLCFGMIVFLIYDKFIANLLVKLSLVLSFVFLVLSVFGGGRLYIYYLLIFSPFINFGFIVVLAIFYEKVGELKAKKVFLSIVSLVFLVMISYTLAIQHNTYMLKIDKEDLVQYKFTSIINETEEPILLNYGVLDLGFYTTTGIIPNVRFFQNQNIPYSSFPLVMDEQNRYIREGIIDYIVTLAPIAYCNENLEIPHLYENYYLIGKEIQLYEENNYCYFLFMRKLVGK